MKIEVYAVPDFAFNSDEMIGYTFNVIMSHQDGMKVLVGDFSVSKKDEVLGSLDPNFEGNAQTIAQAKKIMLDNGLSEIVDGRADPRHFFWKDHIAFPIEVDMSGTFDRALAMIQSGKAIEVSEEQFELMMQNSNAVDMDESFESESYDGIYGSDEYDFDNIYYDDLEDGEKQGRKL